MAATLSPDAIALIKSFEGCSRHPEWPGFASGVTIGYGVDIGADTSALDAWKPYLSAAEIARLATAKGVTGDAARPLAASLSDISIRESDALTVFTTFTLPRYITATLKAFPGSDALPDDSFGALVSLVFNRGGSTVGNKRGEMANIKAAIAAGSDHWTNVILEIAKMVIYWNDGVPTESNLPGRRLAEASLYARGMRAIGKLPGALIKGDKSNQVAAMQKKLKIGDDGAFGAQTMIEVWKYQKKSTTLPDTGVADAATLQSL